MNWVESEDSIQVMMGGAPADLFSLAKTPGSVVQGAEKTVW